MLTRSVHHNVWIILNWLHRGVGPIIRPEKMYDLVEHYEEAIENAEPEDRSELIAYYKRLQELEDTSPVELERTANEIILKQEAAHPLNTLDYTCDELDYQKWLQLCFVTVSEASALCIGRKPDLIGELLDNTDIGTQKMRHRYRDVFLSLERQCEENGSRDKVSPRLFFDWLTNTMYPVPGILISILEKNEGVKSEKLASPPKSQAATTREKNQMLKIIIGMAMAKYNHKPLDPKRSSTAINISNSLRTTGIEVSEDTIRKYLKEAKEQLPDKF